MAAHTQVCNLKDVHYDNLIFENGQGLLLNDTGKDTYDTTPSQTGIRYSLELLKEIAGITDVTAHYVTRPYLTRHGDGFLSGETTRQNLSSSLEEDRTNHYNEGQGEFRYGVLNIADLHDRVTADAGNINFELEVTHCDEMDRLSEFQKSLGTVHTYHSPLV